MEHIDRYYVHTHTDIPWGAAGFAPGGSNGTRPVGIVSAPPTSTCYLNSFCFSRSFRVCLALALASGAPVCDGGALGSFLLLLLAEAIDSFVASPASTLRSSTTTGLGRTSLSTRRSFQPSGYGSSSSHRAKPRALFSELASAVFHNTTLPYRTTRPHRTRKSPFRRSVPFIRFNSVILASISFLPCFPTVPVGEEEEEEVTLVLP